MGALLVAACAPTSDPSENDQGTGGTAGQVGSTAAVCHLPARIWRLNDAQYVNAIRDLLPNVNVPPVQTPGRNRVEFIDLAGNYPVSGALTSLYREAARGVAMQASTKLDALVGCKSDEGDAVCGKRFVEEFGTRAFRRPLTDEERTGLVTVYDVGAADGFESGISLVLEAIFQSASFIYRTELASKTQGGLDVFELASSLSFFLLDSIPDAELWQTAKDGSLVQQDFWLPQGGLYAQTASGDASQFTLNSGYTAFESVRPHMTLVEGLHLDIEGDAHSAAVIRFMTGGDHTGGDAGDPKGEWAKYASVDQLLLNKSGALQGTRVPSLQLIADDRQESSNPAYVTLSWGLNAKPMTPSVFPHQVYDRLFGGIATPQDPAAAARQLKREQSVLDFIKSDVSRLESRVPKARRQELQSHLQGIRELEGAVLASLKAGGERPTRPAEIDARVSANHAKAIDAHFAIMRSALSLDVTRVATFGYGSSNSFVDFAEIIGGAQFLENIDYPFAKFGVHALAHRDEGKKSAALLAITQWYAKKTAQFITSLAATPDSDGGTLLDNTLVVLFSGVVKLTITTAFPWRCLAAKTWASRATDVCATRT